MIRTVRAHGGAISTTRRERVDWRGERHNIERTHGGGTDKKHNCHGKMLVTKFIYIGLVPRLATMVTST